MKTEFKSGVYCWLNKVNGKRYIGSAATGILKRLRDYRYGFAKGRCHNSPLLRAWLKYGSAKFQFIILERCSPDKCVEREQYWMDFYKSYDSRYGYNLRVKAETNLGYRWSAERRAKQPKYVPRQELIDKLIERNKLGPSPETRVKMSLAKKGRKMSEENKAKRRGKKHSAETRAKMSKSQLALGRVLSEETKRLLRSKALNRMKDPTIYEPHAKRLRERASEASLSRWAKHRQSEDKITALVQGKPVK